MMSLSNKNTDPSDTLTSICTGTSFLQNLKSTQLRLKKSNKESINEIRVKISSGNKKESNQNRATCEKNF